MSIATQSGPLKGPGDAVLEEVVRLVGASFPSYLADAGIWTYPGREEIKLALADLAGDLANVRDRAAVAIENAGRAVPRPEYPLRFTATHDLDLRALLPRVIESLRAIASGCERISEGVGLAGGDDPPLAVRGAELAREARGTALGHLDVLEQLLAKETWPAPAARGGVAPDPR